MRIALVSSSFDPYAGGVEEHVRQVARELARAGDEVEVWTVDRGEHLGERVVDGIRVRYLPTPLPARTVPALARFALRSPSAWRRWRRACREFQPDLLHVHCFGPNGVYALRVHRVTGAPLGITSHGETLGDDNGAYARSRLLRDSLTAGLQSATFVTGPSTYVLDDLRRSYGLRGGIVVPNGVDLDVLPSTVDLGDAPYILAVGRLGHMKGFDLLIDAFAGSGLASTHRLMIVGDGPERDRLERGISAAALDGRVGMLGQLPPEAVAGAMAGAQAVVVPSRSEAFGIVALEAWRSKTALIMTSRGGGAEFVRHDVDGVLVDPEDTPALTAALQRVADDESLRRDLTRAGMARVQEYSWRRVAMAYRKLFTR